MPTLDSAHNTHSVGPPLHKCHLFGVDYSATDYEEASKVIIDLAHERASFGVSALAVHGLVTSVLDPTFRRSLTRIQMIVPDGQPVRWALNHFYKTGLSDRVYGPQLTVEVLQKAAERGLRVYLYGSTQDTLSSLVDAIGRRFPGVVICGTHVDRFREATSEEDDNDVLKINGSEANIVLVGRGCPRQEMWVANHVGKVHAPMMAVGAAFDFIAGRVKQAPAWMQRSGLEWLFRLLQEPRRLWKRYLVTNAVFIYLMLKHTFILRRPSL